MEGVYLNNCEDDAPIVNKSDGGTSHVYDISMKERGMGLQVYTLSWTLFSSS